MEQLVLLTRYFLARKEFQQARSYLALGDWATGQGRVLEDLPSLRLEYFLRLLEVSVERLRERRQVLVAPRKEGGRGETWVFPPRLLARVTEHQSR